MPLVAIVLIKELILHLPRTTCFSLPGGHHTHGPCARSAGGEGLLLPSVPLQEVALWGPSSAAGCRDAVGRGVVGAGAALTAFCGPTAASALLWVFPKSLKHKGVVKPLVFSSSLFSSSLFMGLHITISFFHSTALSPLSICLLNKQINPYPTVRLNFPFPHGNAENPSA